MICTGLYLRSSHVISKRTSLIVITKAFYSSLMSKISSQKHNLYVELFIPLQDGNSRFSLLHFHKVVNEERTLWDFWWLKFHIPRHLLPKHHFFMGRDDERWDFWVLSVKSEVAQWLGHRIADRKISSSSPALPTVLRVRDWEISQT